MFKQILESRFGAAVLALSLLLWAFTAHAASNQEQVGDYIIYYTVIPTSSLDPQVAQSYGITRSKALGLVRVTVVKLTPEGNREPVTARVSGQVSNLAGQLNSLGFKNQQVGQNQGAFSWATFRFSPADPLRFNLRVTYTPQQPAHELSFIQRLYMD